MKKSALLINAIRLVAHFLPSTANAAVRWQTPGPFVPCCRSKAYDFVILADKRTRQAAREPILLMEHRSPISASGPSNPHQNHLLDALPSDDYERVASHLELLSLNLGDVLYESGGHMHYVYFPTTSIISLLYVLQDGASAEIAIVGNEGILGISLFMGATPPPVGRSFKVPGTLSG